jgi:CHASE2 domain-containing sensor protein/predicted enzyme related to lactoylglutathione lyase
MSIETNPSARLIVRLVVYSLLGWFFLSFNPFGIGDKTDQATQNALYKIAAPYYLSDAQQDIVIVLINQSSINELYERQVIQANEWPIRYRDHAYLLSRILKYSPRAVFVDIYFKQERSTDDSFDQFMRLAGRMSKKYESPLLFAGGYHDEQYTGVQRKLDELGELVVNGWQDYGQAYPLNDQGRLTAAYRLYQLACLHDSSLSSCQQPLINSTDIEDGDAVSVRWGSRPGPVLFPEFSRSVCADRSGSVIEVGRQLLYGFIEGLVSYDDLADPVNAQCAYHPVIYGDELVYIDKSGTDEQKLRLAAALKNKVVMYALSLEGLHDTIHSPVHGQLPGVFFHAMALDNLMHYGTDFVQAANEQIDLINLYVWMLMTVIFSLMLFYYDDKAFLFSAKSDQWVKYESPSTGISALRLFWVAALSIIIISVLMFMLMRYEPLNSIGFLVLIGVTSGLVHSNFAEQVLKVLTFSWLLDWFSRLTGYFSRAIELFLKLIHSNFIELILKALSFSWLFGGDQRKDKESKDSVSEKTVAFYKDIFGLELIIDQGWIRINSTGPEKVARVSLTPEIGSCTATPDLFIQVDNIETVLGRVKQAEVAIQHDPVSQSSGIRRFYFRDPFGKLVNVFQCEKKVAGQQGKTDESLQLDKK